LGLVAVFHHVAPGKECPQVILNGTYIIYIWKTHLIH